MSRTFEKIYFMHKVSTFASEYSKLLPHLDERSIRLVLASNALSLGRGGKMLVSIASGISRSTIDIGIAELNTPVLKSNALTTTRVRKAGGGRKKAVVVDAKLIQSIEEIVAPHTMGNPMTPLRWTSKSFRKICKALQDMGHTISHETTGKILKSLGYSIQQNKKTDEGGTHIDRDAQFLHINETATAFLAEKHPVISVDCKKKELIGNYKNKGAEWLPAKKATEVKVYDFIDTELGKAIPYGVYDIAQNEGFVNVGISHDTAALAVATIRAWWNETGKERFKASNKIYITADGGGSNSSRSRLWKSELQTFANETGLEITVSRFPPGTSKWNKIEHRLFSYISINWRAKPLTSLQVTLDLIAATTTKTGLKVKSRLDKNCYPLKIKITDKEMGKINLIKNDFHGEWNYIIKSNIV